jgi:hypothetical protein
LSARVGVPPATVTALLNTTWIEIVDPGPYVPSVVDDVTFVTTGTYVKWSADEVAEVPPPVVTVTSTCPAARAGEFTVIVVELTTTTPVPAVPPKLTVAPVTKSVPVIVTDVRPAVEPWLGLTAETVGATM